MSHFGRSGPPDIRDTSLSSTSLSAPPPTIFCPLFDKYGKVVDVFIPRDRRTGESRGFAFARYKYADVAQKEVDRLDGRVVDGREIMVQYAKFGPNAERIQDGRIAESASKIRRRSRSRSPRRRYQDGYRDRDRDYRRSRSRSRGRCERYGYRGRDKDYHRRSVSHSPDHRKDRGRGYEKERHSQSRSYGSPNSPKSTSPRKVHLRDGSPNGHNDNKHSPTSKSASPHNEPVDS
ncbi:SERINE/ARGININE-RICH SPLICING FACTOR SC35-LIKE [Salix koriyanagi]|uniref:SERINE/ARGININE-RICH SPLICING FACTOR SC35-LIKE n=1 Tax=Salix koriyanagi TaxID=2511006 RepID=A0A9Q0TD81_9ROSI|nr:SERINE/ARGININE-RICH SPLICING FACTOR SC35-LIKE [Salix koriyanagi]